MITWPLPALQALARLSLDTVGYTFAMGRGDYGLSYAQHTLEQARLNTVEFRGDPLPPPSSEDAALFYLFFGRGGAARGFGRRYLHKRRDDLTFKGHRDA